MNIQEKRQKINKINNRIDVLKWTEIMMDAFLFGYKLGKQNKKDKIDMNNPDHYECKAFDRCMEIGCGKPTEWFVDDGIGLCDGCFKKLEKEFDKKRR